MTRSINRVAIIGTGVIGASWAALFLAKGLEVAATDVAPNAEASLKKFIEEAWPALKRLGLSPGASQANLKFTPDLSTAVRGADFVQENGPERIDFKKKLYGQLDELLPADVIIASSSSGLTMSEIQSGCPSHPERCVIGHPFNPPHIIPLVEIVGGAKTSEDTIRRASEFYTGLGKRAVTLPIAFRPPWRARYITSLLRELSALPTSTLRCVGGLVCGGASWVRCFSTTLAVARAASNISLRSSPVPSRHGGRFSGRRC
jgi:3-hydroxyacyl-CoA dehydrogenase